jgi:hypothetical protein
MSETPAPASKAEDFIDVFVSPAELFRRRSDGRFGLALLVLVALTAILFFATRSAMQPIMDAEFARAMAGRNLTPEQVEAGRKMAGTFGAVGIIVGTPLAAFLLGVAVLLAGRMVGARVTYAQATTIGTFALFPKVIGGAVGGIQALLLDESKLNSVQSVALGVGRFLDPDRTGAALLAFVGRIEVFTIWVTILIAIGLREMGKIPAGQAAIAAVVVWFLGALPTVLPALLRG